LSSPEIGQNQEESEEKLKAKLGEIKLKAKEEEVKKQAASLGLPYVNLIGLPISTEAIGIIPETQARQLGVICFFNAGLEVKIGAINPARPELKELFFQIEERTHRKASLYMISAESFTRAVALYAALPKIKPIVKGVEIAEAEIKKYEATIGNFKDLDANIQKATTTDILNMAVAAALKALASDLHIEAEEAKVKFRFRLDGVLYDVAALDKEKRNELISRIKLISGLKINVADKPQDGRFTIFLTGDRVEVRVSTIPTAFGESVVMRFLRSATQGVRLEDLGIRGKAFEELLRQIERPNGMVITTGPTGSGKTTTMYAVISRLISPEIKIVTLEDPVEYRISGVAQSQVDISHDYTFAKGLRSILRQDPNVILVGEIRDLETADIAIQAALTGHLVLSTIHTNDAAGAIPRFLALGVKPFLLAPALNTIIAQRLVRKICQDCKIADALDETTLTRVKEILKNIPGKSGVKADLQNLKFWKSPGCDACNKLGYKGRIGIYEVLIMNKDIEKEILSGAISEYRMRELASDAGMITMTQDGLLKALDGITDVAEIFRVAE